MKMQSQLNKLICGISAALLLPTGSAIADIARDDTPSFTISPGYYHFTYKEYDDDGSVLDSEEGDMPSLEAKLEVPYRLGCGILETQYAFRGAFGRSDYVGSYIGDGSAYGSVKAKTDNQIYEGEIDLGYSYDLTPDFRLGAYIGIGYHYWDRDLSGPGGYEEIYSWFYSPIGARLNWAINECWTVKLDGAWMPMFQGHMQAKHGAEGEPVYKLGNKDGWRVAASAEYAINACWSVGLTPWYQRSAIGQSSKEWVVDIDDDLIIGQSYEPKSRTYAYGANFNIKYKF